MFLMFYLKHDADAQFTKIWGKPLIFMTQTALGMRNNISLRAGLPWLTLRQAASDATLHLR